jgi:hypothetical protein
MMSSINFSRVILEAAEICGGSDEEKGGVILEKDDSFLFVPLRNDHAGTHTAIGLYVANRAELGEKIIERIREGWRLFASFHTHPSFSATPSQLDLTVLFRGFKHNVIYSAATKTFSYSTWRNEQSVATYTSLDTVLSTSQSK